MLSIIDGLSNKKPKLLLHSCCAPCSSGVLEQLIKQFDITIFYYNPNIYPSSEYDKRVKEQKKFIKLFDKNIKFLEIGYESANFYKAVKGMEDEKEGKERCFTCYRLRLEKTALLAKEQNYDYFTTTLSLSPYKNANKLNDIGKELSTIYDVKYLYSDFKKNNGYLRSIENSKKYNLYRQPYCGCEFSYQEYLKRFNK